MQQQENRVGARDFLFATNSNLVFRIEILSNYLNKKIIRRRRRRNKEKKMKKILL